MERGGAGMYGVSNSRKYVSCRKLLFIRVCRGLFSYVGVCFHVRTRGCVMRVGAGMKGVGLTTEFLQNFYRNSTAGRAEGGV